VLHGDGKVCTVGKAIWTALIDDIAADWDNADWKKQLGWLEID